MSKGDLLMDVKNVSVTFGTGSSAVEAVKNCSIKVHEGEPIGIVGESGSGKSTLARVMAGLQQPSAGEIFFRGESIYKGNKSYQSGKRNQVQMVFQDPYGSIGGF